MKRQRTKDTATVEKGWKWERCTGKADCQVVSITKDTCRTPKPRDPFSKTTHLLSHSPQATAPFPAASVGPLLPFSAHIFPTFSLWSPGSVPCGETLRTDPPTAKISCSHSQNNRRILRVGEITSGSQYLHTLAIKGEHPTYKIGITLKF